MSVEVNPMEAQKNKQPIRYVATKEPSAPSKSQAQDFLGDVKSEIQKIHWTSFSELLAYTKIVVGATFFFGMAIYLIDLSIQASLTAFEYLVRFVIG